MLVSVIIPAYNCENTIADCLSSVIAQSYAEIEIIVVDDGSTDHTSNIVKSYQKKASIVLLQQENRGPGAARNRGIQIAKGEYLVFIDADDTVDVDYIKSLVHTAKEYQLDFVMCYFYKKKKEKRKSSDKVEFYQRKPDIFNHVTDMINAGILNSSCCKLYCKRILDQECVYMPEDIEIGEDLQFNLRYIEKVHAMGILHKYLYYYRTENSHLTKKYRHNLYEYRKKSILMLQNFFRRNQISNDQYIYFLIIKLMYADCMQLWTVKSRKSRYQRISRLLAKKEIQKAIENFQPDGFLQQVLYFGCKKKKVRWIDRMSYILYNLRRILPRIQRASV